MAFGEAGTGHAGAASTGAEVGGDEDSLNGVGGEEMVAGAGAGEE